LAGRLSTTVDMWSSSKFLAVGTMQRCIKNLCHHLRRFAKFSGAWKMENHHSRTLLQRRSASRFFSISSRLLVVCDSSMNTYHYIYTSPPFVVSEHVFTITTTIVDSLKRLPRLTLSNSTFSDFKFEPFKQHM